MRRFELIEGTSSKFWEIELSGSSFEVRWGRIGTSGQSQTKSFPTEAKALTEHDKLVKEKTGKGYVEVGGAPSSAASAPSAPEPKAKAKAATKPKAGEPAPAPEASIGSAPSSASHEPSASTSGQGLSSGAATASVASAAVIDTSSVVLTDPRTWPRPRREHLPPRPAWAEAAPSLDRSTLWKKVRERVGKTKANVSSAGIEAARARAASVEAPSEPAPIETEVGLAILLASTANAWSDTAWIVQGMTLAIDHWIVTGGHAAALRAYAALARAKLQWMHYAEFAAVTRLAEHLAPLSADERAALRELEDVRDASFAPRRMRLFPETREADAFLQAGNAGAGNELVAINELASIETLGNGHSLWSLKVGARYGDMSALPVLYTWVAVLGEAALPVLVKCLDAQGDAETFREVAEVIGFVGTAAAFSALASRASDKNMLQALREASLERPRVALAPLVNVALQRGTASAPCRTILAQLVRAQGAELEAAIAQLGEAGQKLVAELRDKHVVSEEASEAELPRFLVSPPWLDKKKKGAAGSVAGLAPLSFVESMAWPAGLEAKWRGFKVPEWAHHQVSAPNFYMEHWGVPRELAERLGARDDAADDALLREAAQKKMASWFTAYGSYLGILPPRLVRKLVEAFASARWWAELECFQRFAVTEGLAFLDAFLAYARSHLENGLEVLLPYRSPRVAILAADAIYRLKKKPPAAKAWLLAHPEAAAIGLVPIAIGAASKARDAAEHGLRLLASEGHEATVMDVAARHGEAASAATRAVLDFDALDLFPSKIPALPDFASPSTLPRLVLSESGNALPESAMRHVLTMLAISRLDGAYAGVARVKAITTTASQSELAWELFSSWNVAGAPSKEGWAFTAMGLLGDDECARRITPLIRTWPGESQHQRAVTGLDVLATIGTDVALMHLHGIAQKLKFKGLQEKAREKIDQIAEARGLSADELADRLVPDLGLDDDGSLTLDFGPRRFRVVFDEALKPQVKEEGGKVLADLPKPRKDDDADKSAAAVETWKALKKDAKTIAQQQVLRLELAMCARRRWSPDVFQRFLVEHPLVRHLVLRLAWGAYDATGALLARVPCRGGRNVRERGRRRVRAARRRERRRRAHARDLEGRRGQARADLRRLRAPAALHAARSRDLPASRTKSSRRAPSSAGRARRCPPARCSVSRRAAGDAASRRTAATSAGSRRPSARTRTRSTSIRASPSATSRCSPSKRSSASARASTSAGARAIARWCPPIRS
jgi:predicted DNA-binding WGR domain protein